MSHFKAASRSNTKKKRNDRVVALSKAGEILTSHGLGAIEGIPGPMGVTIDSKLNLLVTNGTDTLYGWNQYFNYVGIDSVAERAIFTIQGEDTVLSFRQVVEMAAAGEPVPDVRSPLFEKDEALIAQATSVYPIYVDEQEDAQLNGVAAGRFGSNVIYVTESNYDRITRIRLDPRLAGKPRQGAVLTLSLATSTSWKDQDGQPQTSTEWHRVVVWRKTAETVSQYAKKGSRLYVEGRLMTRNWEDNGVKRYITEVVADQVQFLESRSEQAGVADVPPPPEPEATTDTTQPEPEQGDDLPF